MLKTLLPAATDKIIDSAVTTIKLNNDSVTAAKITHDNTRTKWCFSFSLDAVTAGTYGKHHGLAMSSSLGVPMARAGSVTRIALCGSTGTHSAVSFAYGLQTFSQGDRINLSAQTFSTYEYARVYNINGADDYTGGNESFFDLTAYSSAIVVVEVEFDD